VPVGYRKGGGSNLIVLEARIGAGRPTAEISS